MYLQKNFINAHIPISKPTLSDTTLKITHFLKSNFFLPTFTCVIYILINHINSLEHYAIRQLQFEELFKLWAMLYLLTKQLLKQFIIYHNVNSEHILKQRWRPKIQYSAVPNPNLCACNHYTYSIKSYIFPFVMTTHDIRNQPYRTCLLWCFHVCSNVCFNVSFFPVMCCCVLCLTCYCIHRSLTK